MDQKELEALLQDEQVEKRLQAARELSHLTTFAEQLFVQALGDEDWRVRKEAVTYFMQQVDAAERAETVADLLSHPDNVGLRNAAIEILIGLGPQVVGLLFARLACADAEVRKFIIDILGEIGYSSCVAELLPYLQDEDENVRYAVVETLGKLRSVAAVGALLDLLDNSEAGLQFTIFEALAAIGEGVPVERILPYARNTLFRKSVFNCLGQLGSADAIPVLLNGLSDPLRKNREVALLSFGRLIKSLSVTDCPEVDPQSDQVVGRLLDFLMSDDPAYRRAACYVLSLFPEVGIIRKILPLLADEDLRADVVAAAKFIPKTILTAFVNSVSLDDETALYLIFLLGELGYDEIESLALEGIKSENPQFRYASTIALGKICASEAIERLSDALADEIPEIREAASDALCLIGRAEPEAIIKTVTPYLESPEIVLRILAVRTLGALPPEAVESYLLLALKDAVPDVRCEALRGLSGNSSSRLLSGLSLALTDENSDVRRLAAAAVGTFPAKQSTAILEYALDDSDPWVRMTALKGLTGTDEETLTALLTRGLEDPVGLVVIAALETLERLLPDAAAPFLLKALGHEDMEVVDTSVRLLMRSDSGGELLSHERPLVRLKAIKEMQRSSVAGWQALFEERLGCEQDKQVRQALEDALRMRGAGS